MDISMDISMDIHMEMSMDTLWISPYERIGKRMRVDQSS